MKTIYIFFIISIISLQAENVRWYSDYNKAHKTALEENKILMVLVMEKNCNLCNNLLRDTFQNQLYIKQINKIFIPVIVMNNQKQSYPIEMLYTTTYPSIFFLNEKELFIGKNIYGYIDSEKFQKHLNLYFSNN